MRTSNFRRVFIIVGIASLFLSYFGIWVRFINDPVERTGADFIHFYSAGRIAQSEGAAHVYDLLLQQEIQEQQVGFPLAPGQVLPYNHLPFLIPHTANCHELRLCPFFLQMGIHNDPPFHHWHCYLRTDIDG